VAQLKAEKQTRGKSPKRGLPWFLWLIIALGILAIVTSILISPTSEPAGSNRSGKKAAIVDQLYSSQLNEGFIIEVTRELEDYGFEVDLYQGDELPLTSIASCQPMDIT